MAASTASHTHRCMTRFISASHSMGGIDGIAWIASATTLACPKCVHGIETTIAPLSRIDDRKCP
jgi:hypothetical protein